MIHRFLIFIICIILASACSESQSNNQPNQDHLIRLEGKVNHPMSEGSVVLEKIGESEISTVDTLIISRDSTFRYGLKNAEPGFYRINFYDRQYVNLILNNDNVKVTADGDRPDGLAKVEGSTDTDHFYAINEIMRNMQQKINEMNADYLKARADGNEEKMEQIEERYKNIEQENTEKLKQKISDMGNSIAVFYAVNFLDADKEFEFLSILAEKFKKELPNSQYTQQFVEQIESLRSLAIGRPAPDIALPNPEGDTVRLSSLKGKYVMVDFWAAWCKPCRMENPNVVRLYNKYKDKGFEIYGVSLDRTRQDWLEAIKEDNLDWKHVSDLRYFDSEAASLYNVNAIPATVLLDKEGTIIAKNLRGEALEEKLAEIFGGV